MKNVVFFILLVLFCGLFTACDDSDDYVYETREVFYVANCQNSVSLRQYPSVKAKALAKPRKNTELKSAVPYDDEWHKVTLSSGETGYILSKYIDSKTEQKRLRRKNDRDDLVAKNQIITLSIIDWYEGDNRTKGNCPAWLSIITLVLTLVVGWLGWTHLSNDAVVPVWVTYVLTLINSGLLTYIAFYTKDAELDPHWLIGLLLLVVFLFAILLLWVNLLGLTVELLDGSDYALYHVQGNVFAVIVAMVCGYWIEGWADIVVVLAIVWNIVFLVLYLVEAIKSDQILGYFATLFLWIVCIVPTIVFTTIALEIIFMLACCLFVISALLSGGGRSSSSSSSSSSCSDSSSCTSDVETKEYTEVDVPGEMSLRRIEHDSTGYSGRDQWGDHWEKNWDGTWSKK